MVQLEFFNAKNKIVIFLKMHDIFIVLIWINIVFNDTKANEENNETEFLNS